jgi:pimeloyl-ACP methyl ester carboxylesterase
MVTTGVGSEGIPYHRFGEGDQPLVLIPGLMDSLGWNTPDRVTAELLARYYFRAARDYDVWVLSRPPGLPPDAGLDWMVDRYRRFIDNLGSAHVLGFTLGGALGLQLAQTYPSLVDRLVLVACGTTLGAEGRTIVSDWRELAREGQWAQLHIEYARTMYSGTYRTFIPLLYRIGSRLLPRPVEGEDVGISCDALLGYDARESTASITTPTLVVADTEGPLFPHDHQRDLAGRLTDGHLATIDGGHAVYEESRQAFWSGITRFLDAQHTH